MMSPRTRRTAGLILLLYPAVVVGGLLLLNWLNPNGDAPMSPLMRDYYRAGYTHALVLLVLSLVMLRYVDDALLSDRTKRLVRWSVPLATLLMALGFLLSILPPQADGPNGMVALVYVGGAVLISGLLMLGTGLVRR